MPTNEPDPYSPLESTLETLPFDYPALEAVARGGTRSPLGPLGSLAANLRDAGLRSSALASQLGLRNANRLEIDGLSISEPLDPSAAVVAFFVVARAAERSVLESAGLSVDALLEFGFVREEGERIVPRVSCLPIRDRIILCEPPGAHLGRDLVAAPDLSAYHLAAHARRHGSGRWLDVATGTGVVGLIGATGPLHGTDLNDRALAFAQASSWINGIESAHWSRADLFCEIAHERYDTITYNPPLVELDEGDREEDLPLYLAGESGLNRRFWAEVGGWVAPGGLVVAHTALPEDPDYPRSLEFAGAFALWPFSLGGDGDLFCITCWRPDGETGIRRFPVSSGEAPPRGRP